MHEKTEEILFAANVGHLPLWRKVATGKKVFSFIFVYIDDNGEEPEEIPVGDVHPPQTSESQTPDISQQETPGQKQEYSFQHCVAQN